MGKDWKYVLYLGIVIGVYVIIQLSATKQSSWDVTFAHEDKEPYGTYALNALLPSYFKDRTISNSYKTLYELKDSLPPNGSVLVIASGFGAARADVEVLLEYVNNGGTAFISANHFYDDFSDTLGIATSDDFFEDENPLAKQDSAELHFVNSSFDSTELYYFKNNNIHNYFSKVDSVTATVVARNEQYKPVTLRIAKGKGQLILNCTPMSFTNIYLLSNSNHAYVSNTLSFLPQQDVYRTEFYHLGRMEASSPLRFILTTDSLKWAYYLTIGSILLFMLFEVKRKQRIIPVITPLANTTLEFVATIGNLYYHKGDHKNIAEKKIQFFLEKVRVSYFLPTTHRDELFIKQLSKKSGYPEQRTRELVTLMNHILASPQIMTQDLLDLNEQLERFNKKH